MERDSLNVSVQNGARGSYKEVFELKERRNVHKGRVRLGRGAFGPGLSDLLFLEVPQVWPDDHPE